MAEYLDDPDETDGKWKELLNLLSLKKRGLITADQVKRLGQLCTELLDS